MNMPNKKYCDFEGCHNVSQYYVFSGYDNFINPVQTKYIKSCLRHLKYSILQFSSQFSPNTSVNIRRILTIPTGIGAGARVGIDLTKKERSLARTTGKRFTTRPK
jgi:hypothetical protein